MSEGRPTASKGHANTAKENYRKGQCPTNTCKHPPIDHRAVACTKDFFCYGAGCMTTCKH